MYCLLEGKNMKAKGLNTFTLKMIAIVSMLIDHIGYVLFPGVTILRVIGRIAFPIFIYVLAEGFVYTRDVKKYLMRLGLFALLSEVPYDLATRGTILEFSHQNVFFTLFLAVLVLHLMSQAQNIIIKYGVVVAGLLLCRLLHTDYSSIGILLVVVFWLFRERKVEKLLIIGLIFIGLTGGLQLYALLALPLIAFHNGEQGPKMKTFFYLFYPAHLLILYLVHLIV